MYGIEQSTETKGYTSILFSQSKDTSFIFKTMGQWERSMQDISRTILKKSTWRNQLQISDRSLLPAFNTVLCCD